MSERLDPHEIPPRLRETAVVELREDSAVIWLADGSALEIVCNLGGRAQAWLYDPGEASEYLAR